MLVLLQGGYLSDTAPSPTFCMSVATVAHSWRFRETDVRVDCESIVKVWQDEHERELRALQAARPLVDRPDHRRSEPRRRRFLSSLLSTRPARLACSEQPLTVTIRPARIDDTSALHARPSSMNGERRKAMCS
ncbi:MAG: hypothetical protein OXG37_12640 [Actinomycetia bacterium]|nr:hypothetical protein [Actinomycetes bacterium]